LLASLPHDTDPPLTRGIGPDLADVGATREWSWCSHPLRSRSAASEPQATAQQLANEIYGAELRKELPALALG
jgi:hypothetical protein